MNKQEKENLINSLGQKEERKSIWAHTRGIALVFNTLVATIDNSIGSVKRYARTSEQRKVFRQRKSALRKARFNAAINTRRAAVNEVYQGTVNKVSKKNAEVKAAVTGAYQGTVDKVSNKKAELKEKLDQLSSKVLPKTKHEKKVAEVSKVENTAVEPIEVKAAAEPVAEETVVAEPVTEEVAVVDANLENELRRGENAALFRADEEYKNAARLEKQLAFEAKRKAAQEFANSKINNTKNFVKAKKKAASDFVNDKVEKGKNFRQTQKAKQVAISMSNKAMQNARAIENEIVRKLKLEEQKYYNVAKGVALELAEKAYNDAAEYERAVVEQEKIDSQKDEIERLRLESERIAKQREALEEATLAAAKQREEERKHLEEVSRQALLKHEEERKALEEARQKEAQRLIEERLAKEAEEKALAEKERQHQYAIDTARELEAKAMLEQTEFEAWCDKCEKLAISKADEERKIALKQNAKLERITRAAELKEALHKKIADVIKAMRASSAAVKQHAKYSKAEALRKSADAKAARLAMSIAEKARIIEAQAEQECINKLEMQRVLAAGESLKKSQEELDARAREEWEQAQYEKQAFDIAVKLANKALDDAIESEQNAISQIRADEKQQKVLEKQVDQELKKLKKEADKIAADEKKKAIEEERMHQKAEAEFQRKKRSLRRNKKIEKSSARIQRDARTALHKWSAYLLHFVVSIAVAAITCFFVMWMQPEYTAHVSGLWLMNFWPILITATALAFICQNAFISSAINLALWSLLSMANTVKLQVRDDPVYFSDLILIKEAATASSEYNINIPSEDIGILVGCVIALVLCGVVYALENRGKIKIIKQTAGKLRCALVRFGGFVICTVVLLAVVTGVYSDSDVYLNYVTSDHDTTARTDHISTLYNHNGFPYSFCHYYSASRPQMPEGYNKDEAMFYGNNIKTEDEDPKIHIIMIMDEAYSDLMDYSIFNFSDENDPQFMFKEMAESKNAISGHIVVPGFAGGTAYTEFDVVTGMQTNMLSDTNITAFRSIKSMQESMFSVLGKAGYTTQFEHVGQSWYYNRENAYELLGADETLFIEDMQDIKYKGFYVSDDYVAELIEKRFTEAVEKDEWLFSSNVTIQNHMAYTANKYAGWDVEYVDAFAVLSPEIKDAVSVYTMGIRDANYMLYRLSNFFSATDEPVMLVFFGDHMPWLGDNMDGYKELGMDDAYSQDKKAALKMYETPYLIWCNDAGAKAIDFENSVEKLELPKDGVIQASYLGSVILDLAGQGKQSQWFAYLSEARKQLPVTKFVTEDNEIIDRLQKWTYYKITK